MRAMFSVVCTMSSLTFGLGCVPKTSSGSKGKDASASKQGSGESIVVTTQTSTQTSTETSEKKIETPPTLTEFSQPKDNRPLGQIFCEEGPIVSQKHEDDFSNLFEILCRHGKPSEIFNQIYDGAYDCTGEPQVQEIKFEVDELYTANIILGYAVKLPLSTPDELGNFNLFAEFEKGISDGQTVMTYKVEGRTEFPGQGSVERIDISYRTLIAKGAALYDTRRTYVNNYLPAEPLKDLTLSLESLVQPNNNEFYHTFRQLTVGMKNADNTTTLMYIPEIVIINRIDPPRVKNSFIDLAKQIAKITCETIEGKK